VTLRHHHTRLVDAVAGGDTGVVGDTVQAVLASSTYPATVAVECQVHYKAEAGELLIDCELPRHDVVPAVASYRYIKTKKELRPTARTETQRKQLYGRLIARIALRVLREALDATPPAVVGTVTMNAHVSAVHTATGRPIRPCLVSVMAERDEFDQLHLDAPELDPQRCLRYLNAIVSPHPYDLEAVQPVAKFDLSKYKFVEEMQVAAGLDGRPDLLDLKPVEFEHLVRELFKATGMEAWVTQASRDEGVDAVATNPDPVLGGLCVIQAKRYKNIVGLEAVHALAGVMNDKAAAKGILITTSWFGKASYNFAARNGRIQLIDGRGLKAMMHDHLGRDVLIGLPRLPPGWAREDLT
jgi:restriction system protein